MIAFVYLTSSVLLGRSSNQFVPVLQRPGVHGSVQIGFLVVRILWRRRQVEDRANVAVVVICLATILLLVWWLIVNL